jgi:ribosomal protein L14
LGSGQFSLIAVLQVIDNSGALVAEVINVYKCKQAPPKSVGVATVGQSLITVTRLS